MNGYAIPTTGKTVGVDELADWHAAAAAARKDRVDHLGDDAAVVRHDMEALEAQAVVDRRLIEHLQAEGALDREKVANLEVAMVAARRIGAAMGILMASRKVTVDQAFELLRVVSQTGHRKLRDIADDVLLTGTLPER